MDQSAYAGPIPNEPLNQVAPDESTRTRYQSFSSAFADMDDDGDPELLVASDFGTSRFFHNEGDGTFTDVTHLLGSLVSGHGFVASFADYDSDGDLDIRNNFV